MLNNKFTELGLREELAKAVSDLGFEEPTEIQAKAIPYVLTEEKDLIALAQTGTGKTAAFSLPMLNEIDTDSKDTQTLILCPTRELALQIYNDLVSYAKYLKKVNIVSVFGGTSIMNQIRELKKGAQIVVGTPGRVQDLINRSVLKLKNIKWLILDEADEMLNMGFKEELDGILESVPKDRRTLLFSATMPPMIAKITKEYMVSPKEIAVGSKNSATKTVQHVAFVVNNRDRYEALIRIIDFETDIYGIVFCRTKMETQEVASKLMQDGYSAEAIHGDISQDQRTKVMNRFRDKKIQILVATDVAARGIDVKDLSHVINYNLPDSLATYTHRSGRTGRAETEGVSMVIITPREKRLLRSIERRIGATFEIAKVPQSEDIVNNKINDVLAGLDKFTDMDELEAYLDGFIDFTGADYKDLALRLFGLQIEGITAKYNNLRDINARDTDSGRGRGGKFQGELSDFDENSGRRGRDRRNKKGSENERRSGRSDKNKDDRIRNEDRKSTKKEIAPEDVIQIEIAVGKKDGFGVKSLFQIVNKQKDFKNVNIGHIDLDAHSSVFEVDKKIASKLVSSLGKTKFKGSELAPKMI